jgi:hypothetical protein
MCSEYFSFLNGRAARLTGRRMDYLVNVLGLERKEAAALLAR